MIDNKDKKQVIGAGKSFEELSIDEMNVTQGAGDDVNPETTIPCGAGLSFSAMVVLSIKHC